MAITKNVGRQEALTAYIDIPWGELAVAGEFEVMDLPYNAEILSGHLVSTGLTGVTDYTAVVEDSEGTSLIADMAGVYAAGRVDLAPDGTRIAVPGYLKITTTGNASAGELRAVVTYVVKGRSCVSEG